VEIRSIERKGTICIVLVNIWLSVRICSTSSFDGSSLCYRLYLSPNLNNREGIVPFTVLCIAFMNHNEPLIKREKSDDRVF
jgi:hypothetical protein